MNPPHFEYNSNYVINLYFYNSAIPLFRMLLAPPPLPQTLRILFHPHDVMKAT